MHSYNAHSIYHGQMRVLIAAYHSFELWCAPPWLEQRLRSAFPSIEFEQIADYTNLSEKIVDADVLISWTIKPEQFLHAKKLKWIHSPAAAVHQLMFPELVNSTVVVTNAREVHGPVVAEHIMAVLLALAKRLPDAVRMQEKDHWGQSDMLKFIPPVREVRGAKVCLVGMGSIGRAFTLMAKAMGIEVTVVREHPERGSEDADGVVGMELLENVLPSADYVVLAAPLTTTTKGMMNVKTISCMAKHSCLINVSRGPLVDDFALIEALRSGKIGGAALDVFAEEPLPATSPYWKMENVLVTPHSAAITSKLWERHFEQFSENLRRFLAGETLMSRVDKSKGY